jgi:hypothetical protein
MAGYYNRYRKLNTDDKIISPPFVALTPKETDDAIVYDKNKTRLDKVSQNYYDAPYYGWLILMANPEFGGEEWNILDGQTVRIPLPLEDSLKEYERKLRQRIYYYG